MIAPPPIRRITLPPSGLADVGWLSEVREVRHGLSPSHPFAIRESVVTEGNFPLPSIPSPEWHPYCEFNFNFEGHVIQYIGGEKLERQSGDLMLLGPGTPHYATHVTCPQRAASIYFLPVLFLEMGPEGGGASVLSRFMSPHRICDRVVSLPPALRQEFAARFTALLREMRTPGLGTEVRVRAQLADAIIEFLRWEETSGRCVAPPPAATVDWIALARAMRHIHEYSAEPLYGADVARAVGLTVGRLQTLFQQAIGMSWLQYLRTRRIAHAMALLSDPSARVIEVAINVGFESLSHFNTSFRDFTGMAPTEYMRRATKNGELKPRNR